MEAAHIIFVKMRNITPSKLWPLIPQWHIMDRRLNMRFTVLGGSNEKSFFCPSYSSGQYFKLQNDILELHVALAKKMLHMFEKSMKNP